MMHNKEGAQELIEFLQSKTHSSNRDLKDESELLQVREYADQLIQRAGGELAALELLEAETATDTEGAKSVGLYGRYIVKLALSKVRMQSADKALRVSIIHPAYNESERLLPRGTGAGKHPFGENFVAVKDAQLRWLFDGTNHQYSVLVIDDISPKSPRRTGEDIADAIKAHGAKGWDVFFLEDAIIEGGDNELEKASLKGLKVPKNTKKAGAVYYGFAKAITLYGVDEDHVLVLTDCDLTIDMGQIGNLVQVVANGAVMAAGSRRLPTSVLELGSARNLRANTARYFRKLLLGDLVPKDTQCGAKAFRASGIAQILMKDREVIDMSFDIEMITLLSLEFGPESVVPVAVAAFDSIELSNSDSSVHFRIMQAQQSIAERLQTGSGEVFDSVRELSSRISSAGEQAWLSLLGALENEPELVEKMNAFDPSAVPEIHRVLDDLQIPR